MCKRNSELDLSPRPEHCVDAYAHLCTLGAVALTSSDWPQSANGAQQGRHANLIREGSTVQAMLSASLALNGGRSSCRPKLFLPRGPFVLQLACLSCKATKMVRSAGDS
eukprot:4078674-Amphidinium_carterae.2